MWVGEVCQLMDDLSGWGRGVVGSGGEGWRRRRWWWWCGWSIVVVTGGHLSVWRIWPAGHCGRPGCSLGPPLAGCVRFVVAFCLLLPSSSSSASVALPLKFCGISSPPYSPSRLLRPHCRSTCSSTSFLQLLISVTHQLFRANTISNTSTAFIVYIFSQFITDGSDAPSDTRAVYSALLLSGIGHLDSSWYSDAFSKVQPRRQIELMAVHLTANYGYVHL